ncbi:MAG: CinA family protein, partial [Eubacterium sp.]|nr:CinA family protein [Eubacterium sp.]
MIESEIIEKYHQLTEILIERELTIAAMESCTGGLIGALLSDKEGASAVVPGGFFTYSNETKILSGVPEDVIEKYGVYSKET